MARKKKLKRFPNTEQCRGSGLWRFNKIQNKGKPDEIWYRSKCEHESSEVAWLALQQRMKDVAEYGPQAVAAARAVPTFAELAAEWQEKVVPASYKASTATDYVRDLEKHIIPTFGDMPVDQITRWDVKGLLLGKLNSGLAPSTVNHIKAVTSLVLALAMDSELIQANPARNLGKLWREKPGDSAIQPYTIEEAQKLLKAFNDKEPWHYALVATLTLAGLRLGEANALEWRDIDFENRVFHIRRNTVRGVTDTPKSNKTRKVDMAATLTEILKVHQTAMKRETLARGWGKVPALVFLSPQGEPLSPKNFRKYVWYPTVEAAPIPRRRIHDLRHTYVTLRISAGDNPADVSKQAGHHSVKFTLDRYYHWLPSAEAKAGVDSLGDKLCGVKV